MSHTCNTHCLSNPVFLTSVDAGASLGASLRELASEAAAVVCAQLATHRRARRRLTEHDRV